MWMKDNVKGHLIDLLKNHLKIHLKEHLKYHEKEPSEGPVEEGGKDPGQHWSSEKWAAETGLDQHHLCQPSLQPQDWTSTFSLLNFPTQTGPASSSYSRTGLDHWTSTILLLNPISGPVALLLKLLPQSLGSTLYWYCDFLILAHPLHRSLQRIYHLFHLTTTTATVNATATG